MNDKHTDPEHLAGSAYAESSPLDQRNQIQQEYNVQPRDWYAWVFDRMALDGTVIDLGSGPGDLWLQNLNRLDDTVRPWLTDLSIGMGQAAQQNLPADRFGFAICDSQRLPFARKSAQAVVALGLYDHVPKLDEALAETRRVLADGGVLYASSGGPNHLQEFGELLSGLADAPTLGGDETRFGLENGLQWLQKHFETVVREDYNDLLVFTSREPVLAYLLSEEAVREGLDERSQAELEEHIDAALAAPGGLQVTVQKGLFICR